MTAIRSARPVITSMWCSTISTVLLSSTCTERISSTSSVRRSRPTRRPSARRGGSPPGRPRAPSPARAGACRRARASRPSAFTRAESPTRASAQSAFSSASRTPSARRQSRHVPPSRASAARRTFSRTGSSGNTFETWNVRPSPSRVRRHGGYEVTSSPASDTRPEVARRSPESRLKSDVLPCAVRPDDADELSRSDLERDIGDDGRAADVKPEGLRARGSERYSRSRRSSSRRPGYWRTVVIGGAVWYELAVPSTFAVQTLPILSSVTRNIGCSIA